VGASTWVRHQVAAWLLSGKRPLLFRFRIQSYDSADCGHDPSIYLLYTASVSGFLPGRARSSISDFRHNSRSLVPRSFLGPMAMALFKNKFWNFSFNRNDIDRAYMTVAVDSEQFDCNCPLQEPSVAY